MILFYVYLVVSVVTLLQFILMIMDVTAKLKKRYPGISYEKTYLSEVLSTWFRLILFSFIPILNILMLSALLLKYDECIESTISKIYDKYKDQIDKEN